MFNVNDHTKTKPKPKPTLIFKNCSYVLAYHCVQVSYTTQHRTGLIIFPLILQSIIIAQMKSTGGEVVHYQKYYHTDNSLLAWDLHCVLSLLMIVLR